MTRPLPPQRCPFCPAKIPKAKFLSHLENHEADSYQLETMQYHETQKIRSEINRQIRLSTPAKKRA
jgi:hypothetical protein